MSLRKFGKSPSGSRLERIHSSGNYYNNKFQNRSITPDLAEGHSMLGVLYKFLFKRNPERKPPGIIPALKTDLLTLDIRKDLLVWFGHSSYYFQIKGFRFLVDPVFSGNASPLPGTNTSFKGSDLYDAADIPEIDVLFITHDHYDHLDYSTVLRLKSKIKRIVCGLGVGAHFEFWGFNPEIITELDWNESFSPVPSLQVIATPARHFSGRGLTRNNTLWCSFVLLSDDFKLYLGGDSGYDAHFKETGDAYGPFDLAILDNGQYDLAWKYIHMLPEEVLQAGQDLRARRVFPVHSGKFVMANHSWDEPLKRISASNKTLSIPLITPRIGEVVDLKSESSYSQWWTETLQR